MTDHSTSEKTNLRADLDKGVGLEARQRPDCTDSLHDAAIVATSLATCRATRYTMLGCSEDTAVASKARCHSC